MTKCRRLACPLPAAVRVSLRFHTGSRISEDLCAEHGQRLHLWGLEGHGSTRVASSVSEPFQPEVTR